MSESRPGQASVAALSPRLTFRRPDHANEARTDRIRRRPQRFRDAAIAGLRAETLAAAEHPIWLGFDDITSLDPAALAVEQRHSHRREHL